MYLVYHYYNYEKSDWMMHVLKWHKSTFTPSLLPKISKCWPIVASSTHEPTAGNCDVTMTDCSRAFSMDAFLSQWRWGHWFKEFVKYTSVPSFSRFIIDKICEFVNCLSSDVIIDWRRATHTTWKKALIILQWRHWRDSMRTTCGFSTELIRNLICKLW